MDIVVVSRLKSKTCFPLSTDVTNQFYVLLLLDVGFLISATKYTRVLLYWAEREYLQVKRLLTDCSFIF